MLRMQALIVMFFVTLPMAQAADSEKANCFWDALETSGNFYFTSTIDSAEVCGYIVRGGILIDGSGALRKLREFQQGSIDGRMTFVSPRDGSKVMCTVIAKKSQIDHLSEDEFFVVYLNSLLESPSLDMESLGLGIQSLDQIRDRLQQLEKSGLTLEGVRKKIDDNVLLSCDPIS